MRCQLRNVHFLSTKLIFILCVSNCKDAFLCILLLLLFDKQWIPWTILSNYLLISLSNYLQYNPPMVSQAEIKKPSMNKDKIQIRGNIAAGWGVALQASGGLFLVLLLHDTQGWDLSTAIAVHEAAGLVLATHVQAPRRHSICKRMFPSQICLIWHKSGLLTEVCGRLRPKAKQAG